MGYRDSIVHKNFNGTKKSIKKTPPLYKTPGGLFHFGPIHGHTCLYSIGGTVSSDNLVFVRVNPGVLVVHCAWFAYRTVKLRY